MAVQILPVDFTVNPKITPAPKTFNEGIIPAASAPACMNMNKSEVVNNADKNPWLCWMSRNR